MVHARTPGKLPMAWLPHFCTFTLCSLTLFSPITAAVANEDKLAEQVDEVVAKMEKSRKSFVKLLESEKEKIKKAPVNPEAKRALIRAVDAEVAEFRRTGIPPDHPSLICYSVKFGESTCKTIQQAETLRLKVIDAEVRGDGSLSSSELKNLESQLENVLAGAVAWQVNEVWGGKRTYPDGESHILELRIRNVVGNNFDGILVQTIPKWDIRRDECFGEAYRLLFCNGNDSHAVGQGKETIFQWRCDWQSDHCRSFGHWCK